MKTKDPYQDCISNDSLRETVQRKTTIILPGYLYKATSEASEVHKKRTFEASEVHEIEDDNMSITRSIKVAHTDYRVLKANCYVDWGLVFKHTYEATEIHDTFAAR